jgi:hypothetical protein
MKLPFEPYILFSNWTQGKVLRKEQIAKFAIIQATYAST